MDVESLSSSAGLKTVLAPDPKGMNELLTVGSFPQRAKWEFL